MRRPTRPLDSTALLFAPVRSKVEWIVAATVVEEAHRLRVDARSTRAARRAPGIHVAAGRVIRER
jgi:hypothetical protein